MFDAVRTQNIGAALNNVTLRDATEIDTHSLLAKADGTAGLIKFNELPVDELAFFRNSLSIGALPISKIVMLPNTLVRYVEGSESQYGYIERSPNQIK